MCISPLPRHDANRRTNIATAIEFLSSKYLKDFEDRPLMLAFQVVDLAFCDVVRQGLLDVPNGSLLSDCYDVIRTILEHEENAPLLGGVQKSARKNARRLISAMQKDGLFVNWHEGNLLNKT